MRRTLRRVVASLLSLGVIASLVVSAPIAHAERRDDADRIDQAIAYLAAQQRPNGSIPAFSPHRLHGRRGPGVRRRRGRRGAAERRARVPPAAGRAREGRRRRASRRRSWPPSSPAVAIRTRSAASIWCSRSSTPLGPHGRFGTATVFDDALAVLALEAAGTPVSDDSIQWLVDAQCADGGWQYSKPASAHDDEHCLSTVRPTKDFFQSDTNTTSYVDPGRRRRGGRHVHARPVRVPRRDPRRRSVTAGDTRGASRRPMRTRPRW